MPGPAFSTCFAVSLPVVMPFSSPRPISPKTCPPDPHAHSRGTARLGLSAGMPVRAGLRGFGIPHVRPARLGNSTRVVVVGGSRMQNSQTVADGDAGSDDQEAPRKTIRVGRPDG